MSEKLFILCQDDLGNYEIRYDDKVFHFLWEVAPILNEQQDNITKLNDENEQLRQQLQDWDDMVELATKTSLRNVELDEQNGQLRKELDDCEKFRYTVFKRIGELER